MKTNDTIIFFLFLFFFMPSIGNARHLIGGEMTYQCLGDGNYDINLSVFRDCGADGAPFDNLINIGIYKCGVEPACTDFTTARLFKVFRVGLSSITPIELNTESPCLIVPPNICVELGRYNFRLSDHNINLPLDINSYHIVYQRCCRNNSITNVINPGEFGNTFSVEITPKSQELCNSSPKFNNLLPFILCKGEDINFQNSATDIDGDSLVYQFSPLINGGGDITVGVGVYSCVGANPNPPCSPPFMQVPFVSGFSFETPFGDSEKTTLINSETGIISGIPPNLGQYAYAISVSEYRNGELLTTVQLESQVNIADCGIGISGEIDCIFTSSTIDLDTDNTFEISPNPINNYFLVSTSIQNIAPYTVNLYGFQGNLIKVQEVNNASEIISTHQLEKGIYLVVIELENEIYYKRIIKQ